MNRSSHQNGTRSRDNARFRLIHWVVGLGALVWIAVRSGVNPKRVSYPCQQAAMPLATGWLLSMCALIAGGVLLRRMLKVGSLVAVACGVCWMVVTMTAGGRAGGGKVGITPSWEVNDPVSLVYVYHDVPPTSGTLAAGDGSVPDAWLSDPAIDTMIAMMEERGEYFYRTVAHPMGTVGSNDVVIIKGSFQWECRNGTNTDRIKGVIWRVLNHPEGYTGEVLVCDNTQNAGSGINQGDNNSDDTSQSIIDVVNVFRAKGYAVTLMNWNLWWEKTVGEYSEGNYEDGYIYESGTKVTYPKFRTPEGGEYVSLRYGVWDSLGGVYDHSRLSVINMPVVKAHGMGGATLGVKNWIGLMTTGYYDSRYGGWGPMHYDYYFSTYALVARVMAEVYPGLTILDGMWTTVDGPNNPTAVVETRKLLASRDPIAVSWYAAKYILTPVARYPENSDPDGPTSKYHEVLGNWWRYLHDSAGVSCTMDSSEITVVSKNEPPVVPLVYGPVEVRDDFNVSDRDSLTGRLWWRRIEGQDDALADIAVRDGKIRGYNPLGASHYGGVVWDSTFSSADTLQFGFTIGGSREGEEYQGVPDILLYYHLDGRNKEVWNGWAVALSRWNPGDTGDYNVTSYLVNHGVLLEERSLGSYMMLVGDTVMVRVIGHSVRVYWNSGLIGIRTDERNHPLVGYFGLEMRTADIPCQLDNFFLPQAVEPPVAIQLSHFTAEQRPNGHVAISWATMSESNNYGFVVERCMSQGEQFTPASGLIAGAGTTLELHTYEWVDTAPGLGAVRYRLRQIDFDGAVNFSHEVQIALVLLASENNEPLPRSLALYPNHPNPFNPSTTITYGLPTRSLVTVRLFDLRGAFLETLLHTEQGPGIYSITWSPVSASGIYICQVSTHPLSGSEPAESVTSKLVFLK